MLMKIVGLITVLTIALGAGGMAVASAQSSVPLISGDAIQTQTQAKTAAQTATKTKNEGVTKFMEALMAQTRTFAFELAARAGKMMQVPFESRFGPAHLLDPEDEILPGKPWVDVVGNGGQEPLNPEGYKYNYSGNK